MCNRRPAMFILASALLIIGLLPALAIGEKVADSPTSANSPAGAPSAKVINDEGGPVIITGELAYSNAFFTSGVDDPVIILEDQAGFVDRDEDYIFPRESQVLGQIISDFYTSPFSYSLSLPRAPRGALRDVDNDGEQDTGVMIFAIAHWTNKFGDRYLEARDLCGGGGWSTGYASTRASVDIETRREVIGGSFIIFAPEENQGFPAGFGADGLLFTEDDPIVTVPPGYSLVNLDEDPFVFDRAAHPVIHLHEPEAAAINDYSDLGYADAFQAMVALFRREYAYTEVYDLDWNALYETYSPRFVEAEQAEDSDAYLLAMRDFIWQIPDGHVSLPLVGALSERFREEIDGGLGIALRELDDGRIVVSYLLDGSPAAKAGLQLGAQILAWDGGSVEEALEREFVWAHQALSTEHSLRLQQLRYITRFPMGSEVEITFRNPESEDEETVTLGVIAERASFSHSSFFAGIDGNEYPVVFDILPSGYGYVVIYSFSDKERQTAELWERALAAFIEADVPAVIIDMRKNGGGSGCLADQLGAYFFQEEHILGYSSAYNESHGGFYLDPISEDRFILPPEDLRYDGELAIIIAPGCFSACEFFTYNLTIEDRAAIVGHYGTGGLGGAVDEFLMPEDLTIRFTVTRAVNADKEIHIEAQGVLPTVRVPVTYEGLFENGDPLLQAAEAHLTSEILGELIDGGELSLGAGSLEIQATGVVGPGQRVRYRATLPANRVVSIYLSGPEDMLDTLDTVLGIYNGSGKNLLGENDDADDDTRSSAWTELEVGAQAATFTLEARIKDITEAQPFTLKIVEVPPEEQEESDSESTDA